MTSALLIERNRETAKLTSAYLLEETEISNADVSTYLEEAGGSTRDVIITITRAVGTITEAVGTITEAVGTITRAVGTITRAVGSNHHLKGKNLWLKLIRTNAFNQGDKISTILGNSIMYRG
ncbi:hypothetical protein F511_43638 [Dorcoceras hygrometricum]|uniref:Uncharacterized protein n=1 Tax=Dorcoceras hygrometricum TaxID=472368 RepID=A0A2Z7CIR7_9LAMI|nr:hypothetical protein F511_43638 [Dorcoceras hygrometricum]